jgi:hypothetical protein
VDARCLRIRTAPDERLNVLPRSTRYCQRLKENAADFNRSNSWTKLLEHAPRLTDGLLDEPEESEPRTSVKSMSMRSSANSAVLATRDFAKWARLQTWRVRRLPGKRSRLRPDLLPILSALRQDGFAFLENFVDQALLDRIKIDLDRELATGRNLVPVSNDSVREVGSRAAASTFLSPDVLQRGPDAYRHLTNYVAVDQPFLRSPGSLELALDIRLIEIASHYLGGKAALGGSNLRRSFANGLAEFDTLWFHSDPNSARILKVFFYLTPVDLGSGPFAYVKGSHRKKFRNWRSSYRLSPEDIDHHYHPKSIVNATAIPGTVILADTTGFHRGTKCVTADRDLLTLNYVLEPEFGGKGEQALIPRELDPTLLTSSQRRALDFTKMVSHR